PKKPTSGSGSITRSGAASPCSASSTSSTPAARKSAKTPPPTKCSISGAANCAKACSTGTGKPAASKPAVTTSPHSASTTKTSSTNSADTHPTIAPRSSTPALALPEQRPHHLREGMLYRTPKARRLEARGDYLAALRLYNENILDQFSGHTPYDRAAIIHARHGEYSRAIDVCERYLAHATEPIQRQRFQRRLRALRRKRDHNSIPTPDADRISAR